MGRGGLTLRCSELLQESERGGAREWVLASQVCVGATGIGRRIVVRTDGTGTSPRSVNAVRPLPQREARSMAQVTPCADVALSLAMLLLRAWACSSAE